MKASGNQTENANRIWQFTSIQMFSETSGWASNNRDVLRTTDGGFSWQVVTPLVGKGEAFGLIEDFVDADQAWVAISSRNEEKVHILVFHTTDGGQTWHKTELPQGAKNRGPFYWGAITFTDSRHGWLMAVYSQHNCPAELFKTIDGGITWIQIASVYDLVKNNGLPFGGEISFRDPKIGWLVGRLDPSIQLLYRTQDGGLTWQRQKLKLPVGYESGELSVRDSPVFFSANEGLLTAIYVPKNGQGNSATILYTTKDGGQTWQSRTPLQFQGIVDFTDAYNGWSWQWKTSAKKELYHTSDGGKTWTGIEPDQNLKHFLDQGLDVAELDFINDKIGWALLISNDGQLVLLRTTDGGDSWSIVYPR
ncbi:BNR/Asp-box repeat family protein [Desulfosporosinus sp. OT]|nr:BNR/Asp-box repeat family protein [Desulfosporosinus sp. OT]